MTRDWEWHGDGLTGLPIAVTSANVANIAAPDGFSEVIGSGVSVVNTGFRPPRLEFAKGASAASGLKRAVHAARTVGEDTFYFPPPVTPPFAGGSGNGTVYTVRNGTGLCFRVQFISIGGGAGNPNVVAMRLLDATSSQILTTTGAVGAFAASTRLRCEVDWQCDTTTTGSIRLRVYDGDTTTLLGAEVNATGVNIGTAFTQEILGAETATADAYTFWIDDAMRGTARTDGGPYVPNAAPPEVNVSIDASTPYREGGDSVRLVGGATTAVGSIASTSWRPTPTHAVTTAAFGTSVSTGNIRDITLPYRDTDVTYSFDYTATTSGGQSTTATLTVTALAHETWMQLVAGGPMRAVIDGSADVPIAVKPVLTLSAVLVGDASAQVPWQEVLNDYTTAGRVTGVEYFKRRKDNGLEAFTSTQTGTLNTAGTIRSGTIPLGLLTNDVVYTVTVTPIIDGVKDTTLAKSVDFTPKATVVVSSKKRYLGAYGAAYTIDQLRNTLGGKGTTPNANRKDPEIQTNYIQIGIPEKDPDTTAADRGDPYTTAGVHPFMGNLGTSRIGTYYRDMAPGAKFSGFSQSEEDTLNARGVARVLTYALHSSSAMKWIGLGVGTPDPTRAGNPVVTQAQYDWACTIMDNWIIHFYNNVYKLDPERDTWIAMNSEPDVGANQGNYPNTPDTPSRVTDHVDAPKWHGRFFSRFFRRVRELAPGLRSCFWIGGGRADDFMDTVFDYITDAPDLISLDTYVNGAGATPINVSWKADLDMFRLSTGRHYANHQRMSRLPRLGFPTALAAGTPVPADRLIKLAFTEFAMSTANHTDAQIAGFINGTLTTTAKSARESLRDEDAEFAVWFLSDSGPQGDHDIIKRNAAGALVYPSAVSAFVDELLRTDVTG